MLRIFLDSHMKQQNMVNTLGDKVMSDYDE
jgi:hypothetical protein